MIVKQPNGRYARWSSIVDDFTHMNYKRDEMVSGLMAGDIGPIKYTPHECAHAMERAESEYPNQWAQRLRWVCVIHRRERATRQVDIGLPQWAYKAFGALVVRKD